MSAVIDTPRRGAPPLPLGEIETSQRSWAETPIAERVSIVRALRRLIADEAEQLGLSAAAVSNRPLEEKLVSEVLPLADACAWLEQNAARVLAPKRHGRKGRPFWLQGVTFEVQRQPFGIVLVIGPRNYPLFLPAVHALHALVAGNAVLLKPAPGTRGVAQHFARLALAAGLPPLLLEVLEETADAARDAIGFGVDKVVFTGSSQNGRSVLAQLSYTNAPAVMELSGNDAVLVLADADLDLVVRALQFGTRLNGSDTCIAPRRLILVEEIAEELQRRLAQEYGPRLPVECVPNALAGVERINAADFGLGAAIFSRDLNLAETLASQIKSGFVLINDLIVPTADPRFPFGGAKASGFGVTRGEEGLLEMTRPHVVATRRGHFRPHYEPSLPGDAALFSSYIRAVHGAPRLGAWRELLSCLVRRKPSTK